MKILSVSLLLILCAAANHDQVAETSAPNTAVTGTRVSLTPPAGFTAATQFPGYGQESTRSSIMVTEIPGPFSELAAGFSQPKELAAKGLSLIGRSEIKVGEYPALLAHVSQRAQGVAFQKWILLFGDQQESVMLTATFPAARARALSATMKASLLTAIWERGKNVPAEEGLTFSVNEAGGLKLTKRIANALLYTKSQIIPNKSVDEPLFVVAQAVSKVNAADAENIAFARVKQINTLTDIAVETSNKVVVDGLEGYEIIAGAKDRDSGEPMTVYQTMLFDGDTYYLMQGIISRRAGDAHLPAFKEMAASFKRRQ